MECGIYSSPCVWRVSHTACSRVHSSTDTGLDADWPINSRINKFNAVCRGQFYQGYLFQNYQPKQAEGSGGWGAAAQRATWIRCTLHMNIHCPTEAHGGERGSLIQFHPEMCLSGMWKSGKSWHEVSGLSYTLLVISFNSGV